MMSDAELKLKLLPERFAVCRLPRQTARPDAGGAYVFWAETPEERSLVCLEDYVPAAVEQTQMGLRCFRVLGVLDLTLIGIMARLSSVLAEAAVPVFAVSTWDTDYLLVPGTKLEAACRAFEDAGVPIESDPADEPSGQLRCAVPKENGGGR